MKFRRPKTKSGVQAPAPSEEAVKAYEASETRLSETNQRWPDIVDLVTSLRTVREENNFEPRIRAALTGGNE